MLHPKKVGSIPTEGSDEIKRTNEIKITAPLLDAIEIEGKIITWTIENSYHYIIDWNFDEDRSRISAGHGPENITRLRRFAIGIIKTKKVRSAVQKMRELNHNIRLVFDYLKMTKNSQGNGLVTQP